MAAASLPMVCPLFSQLPFLFILLPIGSLGYNFITVPKGLFRRRSKKNKIRQKIVTNVAGLRGSGFNSGLRGGRIRFRIRLRWWWRISVLTEAWGFTAFLCLILFRFLFFVSWQLVLFLLLAYCEPPKRGSIWNFSADFFGYWVLLCLQRISSAILLRSFCVKLSLCLRFSTSLLIQVHEFVLWELIFRSKNFA